MKQKYLPPLDRLLSYGNCLEVKGWPNYLELGFTEQHIDGLIEMALDRELYDRSSNTKEAWAPIHAWRTLGQLKAISTAKPLLKLLSRIDEEFDDWIGEEIPEVFKMFGPKAMPLVQQYIETNTNSISANIAAITCLQMIGLEYAESRDKCIEILSNELKNCELYNLSYNGFLVAYLVDLKAIEVIDIVENAFKKDAVDLSIMGDFEEVEIALGLKKERSYPLPKFNFFDSENYEYSKLVVNKVR